MDVADRLAMIKERAIVLGIAKDMGKLEDDLTNDEALVAAEYLGFKYEPVERHQPIVEKDQREASILLGACWDQIESQASQCGLSIDEVIYKKGGNEERTIEEMWKFLAAEQKAVDTDMIHPDYITCVRTGPKFEWVSQNRAKRPFDEANQA